MPAILKRQKVIVQNTQDKSHCLALRNTHLGTLYQKCKYKWCNDTEWDNYSLCKSLYFSLHGTWSQRTLSTLWALVTQRTTPPDLWNLGSKGWLWDKQETDEHWKVIPKEGRNKMWRTKVIQKQRQENRRGGGGNPKPKHKQTNHTKTHKEKQTKTTMKTTQRLFFCYWNLKWMICSCSMCSLPSFTLLPSCMLSRTLKFRVTSWEDVKERRTGTVIFGVAPAIVCFWFVTDNLKKKKKREEKTHLL